jgi:hypothetical protein
MDVRESVAGGGERVIDFAPFSVEIGGEESFGVSELVSEDGRYEMRDTVFTGKDAGETFTVFSCANPLTAGPKWAEITNRFVPLAETEGAA